MPLSRRSLLTALASLTGFAVAGRASTAPVVEPVIERELAGLPVFAAARGETVNITVRAGVSAAAFRRSRAQIMKELQRRKIDDDNADGMEPA
jgi:hypothetical protein